MHSGHASVACASGYLCKHVEQGVGRADPRSPKRGPTPPRRTAKSGSVASNRDGVAPSLLQLRALRGHESGRGVVRDTPLGLRARFSDPQIDLQRLATGTECIQRGRPTLGRILRAEFDKNIGRHWRIMSRVPQHLLSSTKYGPISINLGRFRAEFADFGQIWPISPNVTRFRCICRSISMPCSSLGRLWRPSGRTAPPAA